MKKAAAFVTALGLSTILSLPALAAESGAGAGGQTGAAPIRAETTRPAPAPGDARPQGMPMTWEQMKEIHASVHGNGAPFCGSTEEDE